MTIFALSEDGTHKVAVTAVDLQFMEQVVQSAQHNRLLYNKRQLAMDLDKLWPACYEAHLHEHANPEPKKRRLTGKTKADNV